MRKLLTVTFVIGSCLVLTTTAFAGKFDGSAPVVCSFADLYECGPTTECRRSSPVATDIPYFIRIDFKKKKISGTTGNGQDRTTTIQNVEKRDGKTILQGAESARAWSMVIDEESGQLSATASDNVAGFVMFGACTMGR